MEIGLMTYRPKNSILKVAAKFPSLDPWRSNAFWWKVDGWLLAANIALALTLRWRLRVKYLEPLSSVGGQNLAIQWLPGNPIKVLKSFNRHSQFFIQITGLNIFFLITAQNEMTNFQSFIVMGSTVCISLNNIKPLLFVTNVKTSQRLECTGYTIRKNKMKSTQKSGGKNWLFFSFGFTNRQESRMGILTGRSDLPHPQVSQMLAQSCIYTNRRDEKCDCVTQYFDYSVTGWRYWMTYV